MLRSGTGVLEMRDFVSEPTWIIVLVLMFVILPVAVLIVTYRLSSRVSRLPSKDSPPLSDMLSDGTSFAPRFKKLDESEKNVRVRCACSKLRKAERG